MKVPVSPRGSSREQTYCSKQHSPSMMGPKGLGMPRSLYSTIMFTCTPEGRKRGTLLWTGRQAAGSGHSCVRLLEAPRKDPSLAESLGRLLTLAQQGPLSMASPLLSSPPASPPKTAQAFQGDTAELGTFFMHSGNSAPLPWATSPIQINPQQLRVPHTLAGGRAASSCPSNSAWKEDSQRLAGRPLLLYPGA